MWSNRGVLVVVVVVMVMCVLLSQNVEGKKSKAAKMAKKALKRRMHTVVKDLQNNVTALWSEVKQLSQPVHVHLHGDGHVMDEGHRHHHHHDQENPEMSHEDEEGHQGHDHHDHGHKEGHPKDPKSSSDQDHDDKKDHDDHDDDHDHKHHDHDKKHHPDHKKQHHSPGGGKCKKCQQGSHEDKMKMMMMKMMKKKAGYGHHGHSHGEGGEGEEEEDEEWMHRYTHGGHRGTHVHIHLHTGWEVEDMESEHHHALPPLPEEYRYARCDVVTNSALPPQERQDIKGTIFFRQMPNKPFEAKAALKGFRLDHNAEKDHSHLRGLHGHEFGDLSNGCNSLGGHMNPFGVAHGGPDAEHRHLGDFGNLEVKEDGTAVTSFTDDVASLFGSDSMLGRSMVIHAGADDHGKGSTSASKKSGNAGGRIACCVIVACPKPAGVWSDVDKDN